ncbi:MAG: glycosyl transferase family 28 [Bacteroidales bacterium]|jgi:UDP-N-acetylglucosamine transferase subunit ALG13|nr:glycosyl transferase family 28 [Bacteroidales bacterium]
MIFVSLGTNKNQFPRLLREIENLIKVADIKETVIVQRGNTDYESNLFESFKNIPMRQFIEYINKADVVIVHAGSGTLFNAIRNRKRIIAVARLRQFNEHIDNHQLELAKKLSEGGYILDGTYSLVNAWKQLRVFSPRYFDFSNTIAKKLKEYIDLL